MFSRSEFWAEPRAREPLSYRKRKLIAQKQPCSERNAYYQKCRKEQKNKQKRREKKAEGKPDEEGVKDKVKVIDFRRTHERTGTHKILFRGKIMVSAACCLSYCICICIFYFLHLALNIKRIDYREWTKH